MNRCFAHHEYGHPKAFSDKAVLESSRFFKLSAQRGVVEKAPRKVVYEHFLAIFLSLTECRDEQKLAIADMAFLYSIWRCLSWRKLRRDAF